jgi:hypothetical protein
VGILPERLQNINRLVTKNKSRDRASQEEGSVMTYANRTSQFPVVKPGIL